MTRPSLRILFPFFSFLFCGFVVTAFYCAPALGQTYCGPNTVVNFSGSNGSYPYAGVSFDSQGNMYGTTLNGGASGFGTVWKYTSSAGLTLVPDLK